MQTNAVVSSITLSAIATLVSATPAMPIEGAARPTGGPPITITAVRGSTERRAGLSMAAPNALGDGGWALYAPSYSLVGRHSADAAGVISRFDAQVAALPLEAARPPEQVRAAAQALVQHFATVGTTPTEMFVEGGGVVTIIVERDGAYADIGLSPDSTVAAYFRGHDGEEDFVEEGTFIEDVEPGFWAKVSTI